MFSTNGTPICFSRIVRVIALHRYRRDNVYRESELRISTLLKEARKTLPSLKIPVDSWAPYTRDGVAHFVAMSADVFMCYVRDWIETFCTSYPISCITQVDDDASSDASVDASAQSIETCFGNVISEKIHESFSTSYDRMHAEMSDGLNSLADSITNEMREAFSNFTRVQRSRARSLERGTPPSTPQGFTHSTGT